MSCSSGTLLSDPGVLADAEWEASLISGAGSSSTIWNITSSSGVAEMLSGLLRSGPLSWSSFISKSFNLKKEMSCVHC